MPELLERVSRSRGKGVGVSETLVDETETLGKVVSPSAEQRGFLLLVRKHGILRSLNGSINVL